MCFSYEHSVVSYKQQLEIYYAQEEQVLSSVKYFGVLICVNA